MLQEAAIKTSDFTPAVFDTYKSLADAFYHNARNFPYEVAYTQSHGDLAGQTLSPDGDSRKWVPTLNHVSLERVEKIASYLENIGVKKGDRVMILSNSRPEWSEAEIAIYSIGAALVTGYTDNPYDKIGYVLHDSKADVIFAENIEQIKKVLDAAQKPFNVPKTESHEAGEATARVRKIISFEDAGVSPDGQIETMSRILAGDATPGNDLSQGPKERPEVKRDDLATIVYTSGTTGAPKGVMATHGQHLANLRQVFESGFLSPNDSMLHVLPFAHAFGMRMGHMTFLTPAIGQFPAIADHTSSARGTAVKKSLAADLASAETNYLPVVPRILEGMRDAILAGVDRQTILKRFVARFTLDFYVENYAAEAEDRSPSFRNRLIRRVIEMSGKEEEIKKKGEEIKEKIRTKIIGSHFEAFVSGGAKLPRHVAYFFGGLDMPVYEGYGATEANTPVTLNLPGANRIGSAGRVLSKDIELRVSPEGELLVRGPNIASGYYGYPEATRKTFDEDGWYHTRDLAEIHDGYLYIKGRLDDVEVPETGENINAVDAEEKLGMVPLVEHAVFHAHQRPYPVALVTVNRAKLKEAAPELAGVEDVTKSAEVRGLVMRQIQEIYNAKLARPFERVRAIAIIDNLEVGEGLTPSQKVQRKKLKADYAELIDSLYKTGQS